MEPASFAELAPLRDPNCYQITDISNFIYDSYYTPPSNEMSWDQFPPYNIDPMYMSYHQSTFQYPVTHQDMVTPQYQTESSMLTPDDVTHRSPYPSRHHGFESTPTVRPRKHPRGTHDRKRKLTDMPVLSREDDYGQEKDENVPLPHENMQGKGNTSEPQVFEVEPEVFCEISGRLSVVGYEKTYQVRVDEVCRRVLFPEILHKSILGRLLRRGKVKGTGDELGELLSRRGLQWSELQYKKAEPSCLTAFVEGESEKFAEDHALLIDKYIPAVSLARLIIWNYPTLIQCKTDASNTRTLIEEQMKVIDEWCTGGAAGTSPSSHPLRNYSLLTHYLGVLEWKNFIRLFHNIVTHLEQECDDAINTVLLPNRLSDTPGILIRFNMPEPPLALQQENEAGSPIFAEIPARLALDSRKYAISVAEIKRRIRAPERLNMTLLVALLRKSKSKVVRDNLKKEFAQNGISIAYGGQGKRKEATTTLFTSLLEEESLILARDHRDVMNKHFPLRSFAKAINARSECATSFDIEQRRQSLAAYKRLASLLLDYFSTSLFPVSDRRHVPTNPHAFLIHSYTNLTHGFGPQEAINFFDIFIKIAETADSLLPPTQSACLQRD